MPRETLRLQTRITPDFQAELRAFYAATYAQHRLRWGDWIVAMLRTGMEAGAVPQSVIDKINADLISRFEARLRPLDVHEDLQPPAAEKQECTSYQNGGPVRGRCLVCKRRKAEHHGDRV